MTGSLLRIVVGFDGSEGSEKALLWAANQARLGGGKLDIVRAWMPGDFGSNEELSHIVDKKLEEDVFSVIGEDPGFEFSLITEQGRPAKVLIEMARGADMLVVGSRGHGGFTGLLVGSVSQQVTSHSTVGVVVVVKG